MKGFVVRRLLGVTVATVALAAGVWLGIATASGDGSSSSTAVSNSAESVPPAPTLAGSFVLERSWNNGGLQLDPAKDQSPPTQADSFYDQAWAKRPAPGGAKDAVATFAAFTDGQHSGTTVWVYTFHGACVPLFGPKKDWDVPLCYDSPFNTVIDANSGEYIMSYADGSDPSLLAKPLQ